MAEGRRRRDRWTKLAPPAATPLASVMWAGASSSRAAVTLLSTAQHRQAPAISSAPQRSSALPDQASTMPAATTSAVPATTRRPMCSWNTSAATIVVNTSSRLSSSDDVAAETYPSPAASSTGPTAPPRTTATARRGAARRTVPRSGTSTDHRQHRDGGAEVEQPGEAEGAELPGQPRRQRRRDPEQHRGEAAAHDPPGAHRFSVPAPRRRRSCGRARAGSRRGR